MSDGTEFEVDMSGNLGVVAKRFAAELALMNARLKETEKALSRTESASKALSKSQSRLWNYKEHSVALERLRRGHLAGAPAMARFGRELRGFGVHGATLRKFTVDAAKTEAALRRLYRISGGGLRGAATVTRALASRAWNGGLREKAGSALWAGAKGAAGLAVGGAALAGGGAALGGGILGWNMAQTAIEAERVRFALDRITEGQGDKWWAQSADYARRFGLNINGVAENLMQMKASGFSDEMTKTLFLRMGDLRSLGATEETIGRALLAIRQVQAAGRLQGDELNQLSEAGINANFVYDALSKKLGKSRTEIIKLKEAGKLTSE
ncbi:MAG TPA: tape measure protein, partial [Bryobacteraceae bacterium]|nr:tape measure protein [Bryobacteraceae bacterium]